MSTRGERMARFRAAALLTFLGAIVCALLAIWQWDQQWLATAAVLLLAAFVFCLGAIA